MFKFYDINFYKLAEWVTPRWLRDASFFILIKAIVYPFALIHEEFINYRTSKLYDIEMNFQVCYLEAFLNDRFDFSERRIYIGTPDRRDPKFLYLRNELKPIYIHKRSEGQPFILYSKAETIGDSENDFIVFIPVSVQYSEAEIRAMIATKLCGKRFKIQLF